MMRNIRGKRIVIKLIKESKYAKHFKNKNLKAFSADPVVLTPTHYTGIIFIVNK